MGDFENGEKYYLQGLAIEPNHIGINEYLGELYVATNRIDLANERLKILESCNCKEYDSLKQIIAGTKKYSIDLMIKDLISNTIKNLNQNKIKSRNDLNKTDFLMVDFSDKIKNSDNEIRYFLRSKMYNNKNVLNKNNKGKLIIKRLFAKISKNPAKFISKEHLSKNKYRSVFDFISGMTDRYAINLYNDIK